MAYVEEQEGCCAAAVDMSLIWKDEMAVFGKTYRFPGRLASFFAGLGALAWAGLSRPLVAGADIYPTKFLPRTVGISALLPPAPKDCAQALQGSDAVASFSDVQLACVMQRLQSAARSSRSSPFETHRFVKSDVNLLPACLATGSPEPDVVNELRQATVHGRKLKDVFAKGETPWPIDAQDMTLVYGVGPDSFSQVELVAQIEKLMFADVTRDSREDLVLRVSWRSTKGEAVAESILVVSAQNAGWKVVSDSSGRCIDKQWP